RMAYASPWAGAQDKMAVRIEGAGICLPLGGAPSTHILKPAVERFEGVVFNEAFCMKLAPTVGLPAARVEIRRDDRIDYLLVEAQRPRPQQRRQWRAHPRAAAPGRLLPGAKYRAGNEVPEGGRSLAQAMFCTAPQCLQHARG